MSPLLFSHSPPLPRPTSAQRVEENMEMKEIDLKRKKRVSFLFFYLTDSMTGHAWRIRASLEGKKMTEAIVCDRRSIGHVTGSCSSDPATCYSRNSFSKFGIKSTGHFKTESLLCRFFFSSSFVCFLSACWTNYVFEKASCALRHIMANSLGMNR